MTFRFLSHGLGGTTLIVLTAVFLVATGNLTFFSNVLKTYPMAGSNAFYLGSLAMGLFAINALLLALLSFGRATKPVLQFFLLVSALTAYFIDSYGIVISDEMLRNVVQTNADEAFDLIAKKLFFYFVLLGLLPAAIIAKIPCRWRGWWPELKSRAVMVCILLAVTLAVVMASSGFFASFFREHKALRTYANPTYALYSAIKYANQAISTRQRETLKAMGADARIRATDQGRELIILVVGETARADRFSINGYFRETSPQLRATQAMSFPNFLACGTSTAVSVPCMFSVSGMADFDLKKEGAQENLLDVLRHAGVNVLWLENNSDSKGVAIRTPYQNYKSPELNPVCDPECRDEGMLSKLQDYIDSHSSGDIFIVLHQMGNHGPAYFKRYPPSFEKFQPTCQNNDLGQCSNEEINNAYDNAILYTDHFLGKAIELLKQNDASFGAALFYVSDHGESLGENRVYLHGLPRAIAPENQLRVPAIIWLGAGFRDIDKATLMEKRHDRFSHDNVFHTVLGMMEIETELYRPELDLLSCCKKPE